MQVPAWAYKGRTAIEAMIPRDSPISAGLHVGLAAVGGSAMVLGGAQLFPDEDPKDPDAISKQDVRRLGLSGMGAAVAPLFLTAGMQLQTPTTTALARGVNPMYFLSAGALFGAGFIVHPVISALDN